jgi:hypothetical protein
MPRRLEHFLHRGGQDNRAEPAETEILEVALDATEVAAPMETAVIPRGAEVTDSAGERMGAVIAASPEYIVVEQGFFFSTDFYIPRSVIEKIEDAIVHLRITKQDALTAGWSLERAAEEGA